MGAESTIDWVYLQQKLPLQHRDIPFWSILRKKLRVIFVLVWNQREKIDWSNNSEGNIRSYSRHSWSFAHSTKPIEELRRSPTERFRVCGWRQGVPQAIAYQRSHEIWKTTSWVLGSIQTCPLATVVQCAQRLSCIHATQVRARPFVYNCSHSNGCTRRLNLSRKPDSDHRPKGVSSQEQGDTLGEGTMSSSWMWSEHSRETCTSFRQRYVRDSSQIGGPNFLRLGGCNTPVLLRTLSEHFKP